MKKAAPNDDFGLLPVAMQRKSSCRAQSPDVCLNRFYILVG